MPPLEWPLSSTYGYWDEKCLNLVNVTAFIRMAVVRKCALAAIVAVTNFGASGWWLEVAIGFQ